MNCSQTFFRAVLATILPFLAVCVGWGAVLGVQNDGSAPPAALQELPWVRTTDGWERAYWLAKPFKTFEPPLHPATFTGILGAACVLVLAGEILAAKQSAADLNDAPQRDNGRLPNVQQLATPGVDLADWL